MQLMAVTLWVTAFRHMLICFEVSVNKCNPSLGALVTALPSIKVLCTAPPLIEHIHARQTTVFGWSNCLPSACAIMHAQSPPPSLPRHLDLLPITAEQIKSSQNNWKVAHGQHAAFIYSRSFRQQRGKSPERPVSSQRSVWGRFSCKEPS